MRKALLSLTALGAAVSPLAAHAVDVKMSGVVSKALMVYDDGRNTDTTVVDDNNNATRLAISGEQKLDNGLTASVMAEFQSQSNPSQSITQNTAAGQSSTPTSTTGTLTERQTRVGLANDYGALFIGHQAVANDDVYTHDLAAAGSVVNANAGAYGGGLKFKTAAGGNVTVGATDLTPDAFAMGNDGSMGTADSLRLDTATFNGFNGSIGIDQGGTVDTALRYANTFGDFAVDGAIGHSFVNDQATATNNIQTATTMASASVKHSSGLGATVAYYTKQLDRKVAGMDNPDGIYGKVGYAWGPYGVAAEYGRFQNPVNSSNDQEMHLYGVGAQHDLGNGITMGALYRKLTADVSGYTNIKDIDIYTLTMGVKF